MNKKILYGFLPVFLSLVVMLAPLRVDAADGLLNAPNIPMYNTISLYCNSGNLVSGNKYADSGIVTGTSTVNLYPKNGSFFLDEAYRVNYAYSLSYVGFDQWYRPGGSTVLRYYCSKPDITLYFVIGDEKFLISSEGTGWLGFPTKIGPKDVITLQCEYSYNYSVEINSSAQGVSGNLVNVELQPYVGFNITKWAESSGLNDFYSATTNQLNSISSELNGVNQSIIDQTQQQHEDSQAEIQAGKENTDQITNGYDSGVMGDAENKFESGAGDLTDIEDALSDSSSTYVDDFTNTGFDTSFLESVGPSLNYVVTWFTNFWNMGGALTSTYGLSFAIFIAFYILRVRG